jgi:hypothetical protein
MLQRVFSVMIVVAALVASSVSAWARSGQAAYHYYTFRDDYRSSLRAGWFLAARNESAERQLRRGTRRRTRAV